MINRITSSFEFLEYIWDSIAEAVKFRFHREAYNFGLWISARNENKCRQNFGKQFQCAVWNERTCTCELVGAMRDPDSHLEFEVWSR